MRELGPEYAGRIGLVLAATPTDFRPWLLWHFFDGVCAYCGLPGQIVDVDHVVPRSFAPDRWLDPSNLLPACSQCNGPGGKGDYHPQFARRRRLPRDATGFHAPDPRTDDYGALYEIEPTGRIEARPGSQYDRARWNAKVLLRLDRRRLEEARREMQDLREVAEWLLLERPRDDRLDRLVDMVARRLLFYELYDVPLSEELAARARARRESPRDAS